MFGKIWSHSLLCFVALSTGLMATQYSDYHILEPGQVRADGFTTMARVAPKQQLAPDYYHPNVITFKTNDHWILEGAQVSFPEETIRAILHEAGVFKVEPIVQSYNNSISDKQDTYGVGRLYRAYYSINIDAQELAEQLHRLPAVAYAAPEMKAASAITPNDPQFDQQNALQRIQAEGAWDFSTGNSDVLIAIIDSGTDWEHEDLAANIWENPNEIPDNGVDDDNNGKVDDIRGWDFVGDVSINQIFTGQYREDNDPKVRGTSGNWGNDARSHGTQVAGAASAVTNNATGVAAIGYNCSIIPIKVGSDDLSARGIYRGYDAIIYAAELGADIINCSWGGFGYSPISEDIVNQATEMGSLVIGASGNTGWNIDGDVMHYPSNFAAVFNVGSTRNNDRVSGFSNYGMAIDVYAPGNGIRTTHPENGYGSVSGTSFSSPIVAGIAGLVKAQHPDWTPQQIALQIRGTVDDVVAQSNDRHMFFGRANAAEATAKNRTLNGPNSMPGLTVSEIAFNGTTGFIDAFGASTLRFTVENVLSNASSVKITVESLDGYIGVLGGSKTIGSINGGASGTADIDIVVDEWMPWFNGFADVLVTIESGQYVNMEHIRIPVMIDSKNSGATAFIPGGAISSSSIEFEWFGGHASELGTFWAVGQFAAGNSVGGVAMRYSPTTGQTQPFYGNTADNPAFCVHSMSASQAIVGTAALDGSETEVRYTTNGGLIWQGANVSSITPFINALYFWDNSHGILLGDPHASEFGIATSDDGGASWTEIDDLPSAQAGENGLLNSFDVVDDIVWFGTSRGRVLRSTDRGQTWEAFALKSNTQVLALAFKDDMNGLAVFQDGLDEDAPLRIAITSNGGQTWNRNIQNPTVANIIPAYAFANPGSNDMHVIGANGAIYSTDDNGETWYMTLAKQHGLAEAFGGFTSEQTARFFSLSASRIGFTEFERSIPKPDKELSISTTNFLFGAVKVGEQKEQTTRINNVGLEAVTLGTPEIIPGSGYVEGDFEITSSIPTVIQPGEEVTVTVAFHPSDNYSSSAELVFDTDWQQLVVTMSGVGFGGPNSVYDNALVESIAPMPASDIATLTLSQNSVVETITLFDLRGVKVWHTTVQPGSSMVNVPLQHLPSGRYTVHVQTASSHMVLPLVVTK